MSKETLDVFRGKTTLVETLKAKTKAAIAEGERKLKAKEADEKAKNEQEKLEYQRIAQNIIDEIPSIAEKAAENKLSKAKVMPKLVFGRDHEAYGQVKSYKDLRGVAAIVYNYCNEAGLKPKTLNNWDGGGMDSWVELWIDWS